MKSMYKLMNSGGSLSADCTKELGYQCLVGAFYLPYVKVPTFVSQSKYDASMGYGTYYTMKTDALGRPNNQLYDCHTKEKYSGDVFKYEKFRCKEDSVNRYGWHYTAFIESTLRSPHGYYLNSCAHHCRYGMTYKGKSHVRDEDEY